MVKLTPYIVGLSVGIFSMMLGVVPDFFFILLAIFLEVLGLGVYLMLYVLRNAVEGSETRKKIDEDTIAIPLYLDCIFAALLVPMSAFCLNLSTFGLQSCFWMTVVVIHAYLLWELVYYSTNKYSKEIEKLID